MKSKRIKENKPNRIVQNLQISAYSLFLYFLICFLYSGSGRYSDVELMFVKVNRRYDEDVVYITNNKSFKYVHVPSKANIILNKPYILNISSIGAKSLKDFLLFGEKEYSVTIWENRY